MMPIELASSTIIRMATSMPMIIGTGFIKILCNQFEMVTILPIQK